MYELLQQLVGEWACTVFGAGQRNLGVVNHMSKEVDELRKAVMSGNQLPIRDECADIMLLLMDMAHRNGFNLIEVAVNKFHTNIHRTWGEPDEDGVIEHTGA